MRTNKGNYVNLLLGQSKDRIIKPLESFMIILRFERTNQNTFLRFYVLRLAAPYFMNMSLFLVERSEMEACEFTDDFKVHGPKRISNNDLNNFN